MNTKGGNLLLNIGSKADGTIAEGDKHILRQLADWMTVNREAIDSARPWRHSQEGPTVQEEGQFQDGKEIRYTPLDYRFTAANGAIYAIALCCPENGQFTVKSLADSADPTRLNFHGILNQVSILGYDGELTWHKDTEGLHVSAPGLRSDYPVVIKAEPV